MVENSVALKVAGLDVKMVAYLVETLDALLVVRTAEQKVDCSDYSKVVVLESQSGESKVGNWAVQKVVKRVELLEKK